jgi:hypothetical protein
MKIITLIIATLITMVGCVNHSPEPLGQTVASLRAEQTYNSEASAQNSGYVPDFSGERAQAALLIYNSPKIPKNIEGEESKSQTLQIVTP